MTVKRKDLEQHVTNTCEWRIIECEYCEEPHPKRHLQVSRIKNNTTLFFSPSAKAFQQIPLSFDLDLDVCAETFPLLMSKVEYCKISLGLPRPKKMTFFSSSGKKKVIYLCFCRTIWKIAVRFHSLALLAVAM